MNVSPIEVDRRDAMSKYGVNTKSSDIRKKLRFNHAPRNLCTKRGYYTGQISETNFRDIN